MSGFLLVRHESMVASLILKHREMWERVFLAKGMVVSQELHLHDFLLMAFKRHDDDLERFFQIDVNNCILYSGTLLYKGKTGSPALADIYNHYHEFKKLPDDIKGNYALVLSTANEIIVTTDEVGLYKVYATPDFQILSTSLLAVRKTINQVSVSKQELYEYVLCGASYGNKTPINEICTLDSQFQYISQGHGFTQTGKTVSIIDHSPSGSMKNGLKDCSDKLLELFEDLKSAYGNKISIPVTGGFDSRLICACANKVGILPDYAFVLHKDHQQDVDIALQISELYGWRLTCLDNQFPDWANDDTPNTLREQYYQYDGMGVGGVFQYFSGLDAICRIPRNTLLLDGNGGEIFRNTYRLPNGKMSLQAYLKRTILNHFSTLDQILLDKDAFTGNLCAKIERQEKLTSTSVNRGLLEGLYPRFIQKHWLGFFGSTANQFVDFFAPFLDLTVINSSLEIPVRYKTMGLFESELIKYLDPDVSQINSNYGYSFYHGPGTKRLMVEKSVISLSQSSLVKRLKQLLPRKIKTNLPFYAKTEYLSKLRAFEPKLIAMLGGNYTTLEHIDACRITTAVQLSRLYSIEILVKDAL